MFQMKHRILEYLVEKQGFTVFAIEANWPESLAINDYVLHGKGDAKTALAGIYFWTWDTEEVLEMIEWMRRYNADPRHRRKVEFQGFDMQTTKVALERTFEYLASVDATFADQMRPSLAAFSESTADAAAGEALAEVERRFDADRKAWVKAKGQPAWTLARQHARILRQAQAMRSGGGTNARDEAMAANTRWLLEQYPKGTRMVMWAHNFHVQKAPPGAVPMGVHLEKMYGADYVPVGMLFGEGSFQAVGAPPRGGGLQEFTVGPAPPHDLASLFAGLPLAALDVRSLPAVAATWLGEERIARQTGALFNGEASMLEGPMKLAADYEIVLWFARTTRARPVQR
jgi:erythromycin esterase